MSEVEELRLRGYVRALFVAAFVVFVLNKFLVRPLFELRELPELVTVVSYSLPNFCEAVMGLTVTSGLIAWVHRRGLAPLQAMGNIARQMLASVLATTYVLTQEVGFHDLGGNNVYDPNDVVASVLGIALMSVLFLRYGVLDVDADPGAREAEAAR